MKASRMKMERQWRNIGAAASRRSIPIERVLTGRPGIDALIREGFDGKVNPRGTVFEEDAAFTPEDYEELRCRLLTAKDDDVTAILSNHFNVVLGALMVASSS